MIVNRHFVIPILAIAQFHSLRSFRLLFGLIVVPPGSGRLIVETKTEAFDSKPDPGIFNHRVIPDLAPLAT